MQESENSNEGRGGVYSKIVVVVVNSMQYGGSSSMKQ
jgi:hypothetical protein